MVGFGEDADAAVHEFDGALDDGKADAGAGVFFGAMEFLEHAKHAGGGMGRHADAVVGDGDADELRGGCMSGWIFGSGS